MSAVLRSLRPGDWFTLIAGVSFTVWISIAAWSGSAASHVVVRSAGKIFKEAPLARDLRIEVPGPLGTSIVTIEKGRARISSDPSPRQYCVRQGWLQQSGEVSVCLPNEVSVELTGGTKQYDSLNY